MRRTRRGWPNRLTQVTFKNAQGAVTKTIRYTDVDDQLISILADLDGAGTTHPQRRIDFVYDGDQIVLQFEKVCGTGSASALAHRYLWGPAVDQILADEHVPNGTEALPDGAVVWTMTDRLGSVTELFEVRDLGDEFGCVTLLLQRYTYSDFGEMVSAVMVDPSIESAIGYTGRLRDPGGSGLQNNRHRWYDPIAGRWLSEDPLGFAAGDQNLYRYCGNQPTDRVDPNGEFGFSLLGALVGAVGTSVVYTAMAAYRGDFEWGGLAGAAVGGAVAGGLIGGCVDGSTALTATIAYGMVGAGVGGAIDSAVHQGISKGIRGIELGEMAKSAAIGAVVGGGMAGAGKLATPMARKLVSKIRGSGAPSAPLSANAAPAKPKPGAATQATGEYAAYVEDGMPSALRGAEIETTMPAKAGSPVFEAPSEVPTAELHPTHRIKVRYGSAKAEYEALKANIKANGIQRPIEFVEHGGKKYIVNGHHRLRAAQELGLTDVPAQRVELPYGAYRTPDDLLDFYNN